MAWLMIVVSLSVIWLASLCKILLASWSPSKTTFLTSSGEASCKKNVLLVIAHPDDESMFFTPTINYLTSVGHDIHILCMSTGNADGIGNIRKEELYQASAILKIITFDRYGVSGHCNHRDLNRGVRRLLHGALQREIDAWELVSTNLWRKYSGPIDIWLSILNALRCSDKLHCLLNAQPRKSYGAMAQHMSQWVWFRKLFVSLSSYTFVNTLQKIEEGF